MLDKLEMFIALAKEEHFGRAATALGITQPSLSSGIKQLEAQLGVQLVFRGARYGGLTPEGQRALVWARKIIADSRQLKDEMRAAKHGVTGHLRLAVIPTALTVAARITAHFAEHHPALRVTLLSRSSTEILQMLENLDADAGLTYLDNEPLGHVDQQPVYTEAYRLVCPADHPFAKHASLGWEALAEAPLCLLTSGMQNRRIIDRHFSAHGIALTPRVTSDSTVVLVTHVVENGWMTILPADIAQFLTAGKPLALVPLTGGEDPHEVGLIAPHRDPQSPALQALFAAARRMVQ